ncbi:Phosphotyrosyl phosphatase activator [Gigaspora margarita]|uniref:Serine/threonine-protein phosphatase 2A activator n=2 Tax=Gigaspora margarita TaxID=4874 RepID=A0A8H4ADE8_GIGMA|nr:Phosphotyrosyl phosphatase activator [Gigaspora margarita]
MANDNQKVAILTDQTDQAFIEPTKQVNDQNDINKFITSEAYNRLTRFIELLNESVVNKKISEPCFVSELVQKVIDSLNILMSWIDEIPPLPTSQRFGNKAFRSWVARLEQNASIIHQDILPPQFHDSIIELTPYFTGGFGNATRIDYGSGHELSFVAWLCCMHLMGLFQEQDYSALVLRVFTKYLDLVRRLQNVYMLEPAGSRGVWGLDDHQFLSYYWGSAQLQDHKRLKPKSILSEELVNKYSSDYIYFGCIKYIREVKKGPFHEHSPLLYDISEVPNWTKVNSGLMKMYIAEVLKKFPIVQHFVFGSLLPFKPVIERRVADQ